MTPLWMAMRILRWCKMHYSFLTAIHSGAIPAPRIRLRERLAIRHALHAPLMRKYRLKRHIHTPLRALHDALKEFHKTRWRRCEWPWESCVGAKCTTAFSPPFTVAPFQHHEDYENDSQYGMRCTNHACANTDLTSASFTGARIR